MNTEKLSQLVESILSEEGKFGTQGNLDSVANALSNLASQPQEPRHQSELVKSLSNLETSVASFVASFSPRDYERVQHLFPGDFERDLVSEIRKWISENPMSPNVVSQKVNTLRDERQQVLSYLQSFSESLGFFGFDYDELDEGTAELGFQIPRELFSNNLDGLIEELKQTQRMLRFVSEARTGSYNPAVVGSISTTDPLFFLGVSVPVAQQFGLLVTWAIGVWYTVEKIRKIRAETAQIQAFTEAEIKKIFDSKIQEQINQSVEAKVKEILENGNAPKNRHGELSGALTWVLEALLAKMERGLTVELRLPPPPNEELDEEIDEETGQTSEPSNEMKAYTDLLDIQSKLQFPNMGDTPVLEIPEFKETNRKK
ncbi:MAG: hypothetical protein MRY75_12645 [Marivita sp.]|uniref:hypothetical protein n=1 Tax=Marivita sp. TaxID=2003365 RepID=UPI0025BD90F9|nr:hypothetical protein [Marivita sp.]MCI5111393.1 hypothetical protein [Marivita sp.]